MKTTLIKILIYNLLLLLTYSRLAFSQENLSLLDFGSNEGLNVSVYSIKQSKPSFYELISTLRNGKSDSTLLELKYSKEGGAAVTPFDSSQYEKFPVDFSICDDLKDMKWHGTEDVLIHWYGTIEMPAGYTALRIDKADDEAAVYVYRSEITKDDFPPLSKDKPFVKGGPFFDQVLGKNFSLEFFPKTEILKIEIFYIKRSSHSILGSNRNFSLYISSVFGLTLEEILFNSGKKSSEDLTELDLRATLYLHPSNYFAPISENSNLLSPDFRPKKEGNKASVKIAKAAKGKDSSVFKTNFQGLAKTAGNTSNKINTNKPTDTTQTDSVRVTEQINLTQDQRKHNSNIRKQYRELLNKTLQESGGNNSEDNSEKEFNPDENIAGGFLFQISETIPETVFPYKKELAKSEDEDEKQAMRRNGSWHYADRSKEYWDRSCPNCKFNLYMHDIINYSEQLFSTCKFLEFGDCYESLWNEEKKCFSFSGYGNKSLRFESDDVSHNYYYMNIFRLFKEAFEWNETNTISTHQQKSSEFITQLSMLQTFGSDDNAANSNGKDENKQKEASIGERFTSFVSNNLYMKVLKFSGNLRLPSGFIKMSILSTPKNGLVAFINRDKSRFDSQQDLLSSAFIYGFENVKAPSKLKNRYEGKSDETVKIEIYLFHFAGPVSMNIGIDIDGQGYKDIGQIQEYIVKGDEE